MAHIYDLDRKSNFFSCFGIEPPHGDDLHPDSVVIDGPPSIDDAKHCAENSKYQSGNSGDECDGLYVQANASSSPAPGSKPVWRGERKHND
jgi:hypothetical protein